MVHTTGKSHAGGENGGCATLSNTSILFCVKSADTPPTISGIAIQIKSSLLFTFIKNPFLITYVCFLIFIPFYMGGQGLFIKTCLAS
jgi:hypothetical protein